MKNINTKEYWEARFNSGDWERKEGRRQTILFAKNNLRFINLDENSLVLDFGCGLGDAIPVYKDKYPKSNFIGMDISQDAINNASLNYGSYAEFRQGDSNNVPNVDVIIASNVFEHLSNDMKIAKQLLFKCKFLYISVPYMEKCLHDEHVNIYDEYYFDDLEVIKYDVFDIRKPFNLYGIKLWYNVNFKNIFRSLLGRKIILKQKQIIFCIKGHLQ